MQQNNKTFKIKSIFLILILILKFHKRNKNKSKNQIITRKRSSEMKEKISKLEKIYEKLKRDMSYMSVRDLIKLNDEEI